MLIFAADLQIDYENFDNSLVVDNALMGLILFIFPLIIKLGNTALFASVVCICAFSQFASEK